MLRKVLALLGIFAVGMLQHRFFARTKSSPASDSIPQTGAETEGRKPASNTDTSDSSAQTVATKDESRGSEKKQHCEQRIDDRIPVATPHSSYPKDRSQLGRKLDTVIVPARRDTFEGLFLKEHRWHHIRISADMLSQIRYIAAYQTAPVSAITHFAPVDYILPYGDGYYELVFSEPPESVGSVAYWTVRGPQYASLSNLLDLADRPHEGTVSGKTVRDSDSLPEATGKAYEKKIEGLRAQALRREFELNKTSSDDFWKFVSSAPGIPNGDLHLCDDGNLHAEWGTKDNAHLEVKFLGMGMARYSITKKIEGSSAARTVAGRDTLKGIQLQIDGFDLRPPLNGCDVPCEIKEAIPRIAVDDEPAAIQGEIKAYEDRIEYLRDCAREDGYDLRHESGEHFRDFIEANPEIRRGSLALCENGNLRAAWRDGNGTLLALEFLGSDQVEYVIFKKHEAIPQVTRIAGRDTFAGMQHLIVTHELHPLLRR